MLTLIADILRAPTAPQPPLGYVLRPCRASDIPDLGRLYFEAYDPGVACATLSDAVADIEAAFAGVYGNLWLEASLAAVTEVEQLVAATMVVRRAPWEDTPDCPFVIELFTSRDHRGQGLARSLMRGAMAVVSSEGAENLALRVDDENVPALSLYRSLGFREWTPGI